MKNITITTIVVGAALGYAAYWYFNKKETKSNFSNACGCGK